MEEALAEMVQTVLGRIKAEDLGVVYAHEHLIAKPPDWVAKEDDFELDSAEKALQELKYFQMAGGKTVVEMTTKDYGRDIQTLYQVATRFSGHIIVPTGFLREYYFSPLVKDRSVNDLAEEMAKEIIQGIEGTAIKAGVIKAGSGLNHISSLEKKVFKAAARAHLKTGAPISTHTQAGTMALDQLDILMGEGVSPKSIILGHLDRRLDWNYHKKIAGSGAYLLYDQISKEKYWPDSTRIEFILRLIKEGHGSQILLSGDFGRKSYWVSYGGGPGFTYILWRFIPWLKSEGVKDGEIYRILQDNPQKAFQFSSISRK